METSQNFPAKAPQPFHWTARREEAAALLAADELTVEEIAARAGVTRRQLTNWKRHPDFAARIQAIARRIGDLAARHAIARRHRRVARLQDRWDRLDRVVQERSADPQMRNAPGGKTGLLVRRIKVIGKGQAAREVEEYELDAALLREEREMAKQAAIELGQWDQPEAVASESRRIQYIQVNLATRQDAAGGSDGPGDGQSLPQGQLPCRPVESLQRQAADRPRPGDYLAVSPTCPPPMKTPPEFLAVFARPLFWGRVCATPQTPAGTPPGGQSHEGGGPVSDLPTSLFSAAGATMLPSFAACGRVPN